MVRLSALFIFCLFFFGAEQLQAQEDNWWRKLFRKDASENLQEEDSISSEGTVAIDRDTLASGRQAEGSNIDDAQPLALSKTPGKVSIVLPKGMTALDSLYRATPPAIRGFRIQVYFGDLSSAREQRRLCMESIPDLPCYLVQNPPNFAVMLGDYRTHLDAYRDALTLEGLYPTAVVVPAAIEPPSLTRPTKE